MYIPRILQLSDIIKEKSYFLFGPRQTGKSSLIKETLSKYTLYNLLDSHTLLSLSRSPERLGQELGENKVVIIDEIQKLPSLLNEVHRLIEEKGVNFLLTGSSARKLRRGGANLLGGRARSRHLHPFIWAELKERFNLKKALDTGTIPSIYFSNSPHEDLESYTGDYLKEEIASEGLVRNIPSFSRFLEVAALSNGKMINFTEIGSDAQVARTTVQEYYQILKDTLIADEVKVWKKNRTRKTFSTAKFYFFDIGVARYLQHRKGLQSGSPEYGDAFESYMFHELKSFVDYNKLGDISYWRTISGFEVDFVLDDIAAIEVKAKSVISKRDLKGLMALKEESSLKHFILVSFEERPRQVDGVTILPWNIFLEKLWGREFC
ncbi:MAG: ATPase [Deltaproteobacteria bacterium CG11_big_fil_rev_8_21_14_0_20_49_13]|nr:MAG: ATPase [Deltaproteobacteria bacterium CG11_big_fil_rev_8_21_14_0_20_49_13]